MNEQSGQIYEFGDFRLNKPERLLTRAGKPLALTPKAFDLLVLLVERHGSLLTKDELMNAVWADSFVEEANLNVNISTLRKVLGENSFIETVPKKGYRFAADVREINAESDIIIANYTKTRIVAEEEITVEDSLPLALPQRNQTEKLVPVVFALAILFLVGAVFYLYPRKTELKTAEIKSLAVLPFKSLDKEADDHLGIGIADTVIGKVSQIDGLIVRPTSAVQKYGAGETSSLEAAKQLGVDAVLDGSIQRAGDRLRVSANLLRASDGASLWAESFDMRFTDIFTIEDEVSKQVAARLRLKLNSVETARLARRYTANAEAYEHYARRANLSRRHSRQIHQRQNKSGGGRI